VANSDDRNEYFVAVGARLAKAREAKELTAAELAAKLPGVSPARLSNWETGLSLVPPPFVRHIQRAIGADANYLYLDREDSLPGDLLKALSREEAVAAPQSAPSPRRASGRSRPKR
jgi:transcriptional regulator with XRE-family HTH domain